MKEALSLELSRRKLLKATAAGLTLFLIEKPLTALGLTNIHTVKRGETLTSIGNLYGVSLEQLLEANTYITNPHLIYPGKTVQIPDQGKTITYPESTIVLYEPNLKPFPITFQGDFGITEKRQAAKTLTKTRKVLQALGFPLEFFPMGREVTIRPSKNGFCSSLKPNTLELIGLGDRGVAHEYAANFMPAYTQAMVEGAAEMAAVQVLGFYVLPLSYADYQKHDWENELWWEESGSWFSIQKTIWGKITLAAQAAALLEAQRPGLWAFLGTRYAQEVQAGIPHPGLKELRSGLEEFWPEQGWQEFQKHPLLFLSN